MSETIVKWYEDDNCVVYFELNLPAIFIHVGVKKNLKAAIRTLRALIPAGEEEAKRLGARDFLCYNPAQTNEWKKFVQLVIGYPPLFYLENGDVVYGKDLTCQS